MKRNSGSMYVSFIKKAEKRRFFEAGSGQEQLFFIRGKVQLIFISEMVYSSFLYAERALSYKRKGTALFISGKKHSFL